MSPQTFTALFKKYNEGLVRYLRTYCTFPSDAEDVAQNTWIKILTGEDAYDDSLPFLPYLFGAARFAAIDHSRKRKKGKTSTKAWKEDFLAYNRPEYLLYSTEDIEVHKAPDDVRRMAYQVLREMPFKQRIRFRKKYWYNYTYKEIAKEEGLTGVESSMWATKKRIIKHYEDSSLV